MKKFGFATLTAGTLAAGFVALAAPAVAAPAGPGSAQETIRLLEAEGFDVIVNRLSTAPLDEANVVSVGRGQSFTHSVAGATNTLYGPATRSTVYVSVR
jgi:hypothetical protein